MPRTWVYVAPCMVNAPRIACSRFSRRSSRFFLRSSFLEVGCSSSAGASSSGGGGWDSRAAISAAADGAGLLTLTPVALALGTELTVPSAPMITRLSPSDDASSPSTGPSVVSTVTFLPSTADHASSETAGGRCWALGLTGSGGPAAGPAAALVSTSGGGSASAATGGSFPGGGGSSSGGSFPSTASDTSTPVSTSCKCDAPRRSRTRLRG